MRTFATLACAIVACAIAEIAFPGRAVYHVGWFNVMLIAFAILLGYALRAVLRTVVGRARIAVALIAAGAFAMAFAAVISGLLAPDTRLIVAAPGSQVPLAELGSVLLFPEAPDQPMQLKSGTHSISIGTWRYVGTSILHVVPRSVVGVEAQDERGGTLTITQPNGSAFLSPVLLMESQRTIGGMSLPYDSFSIPAMHRIVHALAFSASQAASLRGGTGASVPEVLFAVDDDNDRPLPHALSLARNGATVDVGSIRLRASVFDYPSVEVIAAPSFWVMLVASIAIVVGFAFSLTKAA